MTFQFSVIETLFSHTLTHVGFIAISVKMSMVSSKQFAYIKAIDNSNRVLERKRDEKSISPRFWMIPWKPCLKDYPPSPSIEPMNGSDHSAASPSGVRTLLSCFRGTAHTDHFDGVGQGSGEFVLISLGEIKQNKKCCLGWSWHKSGVFLCQFQILLNGLDNLITPCRI